MSETKVEVLNSPETFRETLFDIVKSFLKIKNENPPTTNNICYDFDILLERAKMLINHQFQIFKEIRPNYTLMSEHDESASIFLDSMPDETVIRNFLASCFVVSLTSGAINAYIFAAEIWMAQYTNEDDTSESIEKHIEQIRNGNMPPPSQRDDRKEYIFIRLANEFGSVVYLFDIDRSGEKPVLGKATKLDGKEEAYNILMSNLYLHKKTLIDAVGIDKIRAIFGNNVGAKVN